MVAPEFLATPQGRRIAFRRVEGRAPGVVFLGGFRSDMEGTKAAHLDAWARREGRAFLRFDYSGHGASDGAFEDGAIGDWTEDALSAIETLTDGPQILVGSSMGGWIALLAARRLASIAGLVGIAAAPDFTEDGMWAAMSDLDRARLMAEGRVERRSDYGSYAVTRRLIEDGRRHLVLRSPLVLPYPVRLLQGTADVDVPVATALRLMEHAASDDMTLTLVNQADHRFSSPACLALMTAAVEEVARSSPR